MMACPTCGMRQWRYDDLTLTCKNGHRVIIGAPAPAPKLRVSPWWIPISTAGTAALDLLIRGLT